MVSDALIQVRELIVNIDNQQFNNDLISDYIRKACERSYLIETLSITIENNNLGDDFALNIADGIGNMKKLKVLELNFFNNNISESAGTKIRHHFRKLIKNSDIQ